MSYIDVAKYLPKYFKLYIDILKYLSRYFKPSLIFEEYLLHSYFIKKRLSPLNYIDNWGSTEINPHKILIEIQTLTLSIINIRLLLLDQMLIGHQIISWINIIYQNSWHQTVVLKLIHNPGLNDRKSNRIIKSLIVLKKN